MALPEEPYTRVERYLARLAGQNVDIPEYPITRIECYLDYLCENGGDVPAPTAGAHNAVFRGASLGTEYTAEQASTIESGEFSGMYVGDYWTIDNIIYRIAGFDVFLWRGTSTGFSKHHVVIVPDESLGNAAMNETDTAVGGYLGTAMRNTVLPEVSTALQSKFGEGSLLSHQTLLTGAISGGEASSWQWQTVAAAPMSETMVYGFQAWGKGSVYNIGERLGQLPLFALAPEYISMTPRGEYWLMDVTGNDSFATVQTYFRPGTAKASSSLALRPYFLLGRAS